MAGLRKPERGWEVEMVRRRGVLDVFPFVFDYADLETQLTSIAIDLSSGLGFKVVLCIISALLLGVISVL